MNVKRKRLISTFASIIGAIVFVFYLKHILFPETLKEVGLKVLNAIEAKNARIIYNYMRDEEKEITKANVKKIQTFLNNFVSVQYNGFEPTGQLDEFPFKSSNSLLLIRWYKHPDGRAGFLDVKVVTTDKGIKGENILNSIFMNTLFTYWDKEKPFPKGKEKLEFMAETTNNILPLLKNTGLEGVMYKVDDKYVLLTWEQFRDRMFTLAEKDNKSSESAMR